MSSTYILIDTLLIGEVPAKPWMKTRRRPNWIAVIYPRDVAHVSPVLIDIAGADKAGRMPDVMMIINCRHPQLGVSFIDTELSLTELAAHIQQFVHIRAENGAELTLRFADCAVLPALAASLSVEQWTTITMPLISWKIHGRDGKLQTLPAAQSAPPLPCPFTLNDAQISALKNAMVADQLLANLRNSNPEFAEKYTLTRALELATQTCTAWASAGGQMNADLLFFARHVFQTDGRLLKTPKLAAILAQQDRVKVLADIRRMVPAVS